ncbi:diaminopimelate decarboxylase [Methanosarcinales archaeon]|nr:MAG: diaminopimelate decarboxylase [Methanosarcinales archaeon]
MFEIEGHLECRHGHLFIGGADCVGIAEEFGTPLYVTHEQRIRDNLRTIKRAFPNAELLYAVKANGNLAIMRIIAQEGAGADVFSSGELYMALLAGFPKDKILFNGNSKSDEDLRGAVESGVMVSVDSMMELESLSMMADARGNEVKIAFRVNPDVSPQTHPKIATGLRTSKFGIPSEQIINAYERAVELPGVVPVGIHFHIGSQILSVSPFAEALEKVLGIVKELLNRGIELEFVDMGSGLGIPYEKDKKAPTPQELADAVLPIFEEWCEENGVYPKLILEPGRYVVGDSTVLLTRVNSVKGKFVAVDAGFNLLIRPVMYDAYHHVVVANKVDVPPDKTYTIVGPICESGDILAKDRRLPKIEKGDVIAVLDVGAYGFAMSSQYNGQPRCAEVLVQKGRAELIRRRETFSDLIHTQIVPERLL